MHKRNMRHKPGIGLGWTRWLAMARRPQWLIVAAVLIGGWVVVSLLWSILGWMGQYINAVIFLLAGASGYVAARVWLGPALHALDLIHQATVTTLYETNLIENRRGGRRLEERQEACRRLGAELAATHARVPGFCRTLLGRQGYDLPGASRALFSLAASQHDDEAWVHLQRLTGCLNIDAHAQSLGRANGD